MASTFVTFPRPVAFRQTGRVVDLGHALFAPTLAEHDARGGEVRQDVASLRCSWAFRWAKFQRFKEVNLVDL